MEFVKYQYHRDKSLLDDKEFSLIAGKFKLKPLEIDVKNLLAIASNPLQYDFKVVHTTKFMSSLKFKRYKEA